MMSEQATRDRDVYSFEVELHKKQAYLANQILHIVMWEWADGCDGADEPLRQGVFTLNALHDVPHSRAHV